MLKKLFKTIKPYFMIIKQKWKVLLILSIILAIYVSVYWFLIPQVPSCMIKQLIGIPCPSCGITRAFVSLFQFDIAKAFYYQPLFWLYPIIGFVILFRERPKVSKLYTSKLFWLGCFVVILGVYIIRLNSYKFNEPMDYYPLNLLNKLRFGF